MLTKEVRLQQQAWGWIEALENVEAYEPHVDLHPRHLMLQQKTSHLQSELAWDTGLKQTNKQTKMPTSTWRALISYVVDRFSSLVSGWAVLCLHFCWTPPVWAGSGIQHLSSAKHLSRCLPSLSWNSSLDLAHNTTQHAQHEAAQRSYLMSVPLLMYWKVLFIPCSLE